MITTLHGENFSLEPIQSDELDALINLAEQQSVRRVSAIHNEPWNLSSMNEIHAEEIMESLGYRSFLFRVHRDSSTISPIIGLRNIDRIQKRGTLIYYCTEEHLTTKTLYEPLKLLLATAFHEWGFNQLDIHIYDHDKGSATMLKGFGFVPVGALANYVQWGDETFDALLYRIIKKDFRVTAL